MKIARYIYLFALYCPIQLVSQEVTSPAIYLKSVTINNIPDDLLYGYSNASFVTLQKGQNNFFDLKSTKRGYALDNDTKLMDKSYASLSAKTVLAPARCVGGQNYQTFSFIPSKSNDKVSQLAIISRSPNNYADFSFILNVNLLLENIRALTRFFPIVDIVHAKELYLSISIWGLTRPEGWSINLDYVDVIGTPPGCSQKKCEADYQAKSNKYTVDSTEFYAQHGNYATSMVQSGLGPKKPEQPDCSEALCEKLVRFTGDQILQFQKKQKISIIKVTDSTIPGENRDASAGVTNPPCK